MVYHSAEFKSHSSTQPRILIIDGTRVQRDEKCPVTNRVHSSGNLNPGFLTLCPRPFLLKWSCLVSSRFAHSLFLDDHRLHLWALDVPTIQRHQLDSPIIFQLRYFLRNVSMLRKLIWDSKLLYLSIWITILPGSKPWSFFCLSLIHSIFPAFIMSLWFSNPI